MSASAGAVSVLSVLSVHGVPMLIRCIGSAATPRRRRHTTGARDCAQNLTDCARHGRSVPWSALWDAVCQAQAWESVSNGVMARKHGTIVVAQVLTKWASLPADKSPRSRNECIAASRQMEPISAPFAPVLAV